MARSSAWGLLSERDCVINVRASTGLVCDWSPACPARNWRIAVVGAGFEEIELLDAVELLDV